MKSLRSKNGRLFKYIISNYITLGLVLVLILLTIYYFHLHIKPLNLGSTSVLPQNISLQKTESDFDPIILTGTFYVGPKPYHLEYESIFGQGEKEIPEKGRFTLVGVYPEKVKYTLYEENYNVCNIPTITYQSFDHLGEYRNVTRFLIEYSCGDSFIKKVLGVATNTNDSGLIVLPALTLENFDQYMEKYYKTVGWYSPEELILNEISLDNTTGMETHNRLVKLNINKPNRISPL